MPNFTDYLLAPWKILSLLATGPGTGSNGAKGTAASGFCSIQDIGGQMASVCHVAGYEMPSFVFWASLLILALFAAASLGLFYQCNRLGLALSAVASELLKLGKGPRAADRALSTEELTKIRSVMRGNSVISPEWEKFEETLLVSTDENQVFSTENAEQVISKATLIEQNVFSALFNAIPGILTGVGLLMTFVAILDGLSHVTVAANMDVKGIGGLINGLSGKFVSSIVAVTCAVCFVFVERIAYSRPEKAYRRMIQLLSGRFRRRTTEHLLYAIQNRLTQMESQIAPRGK